MERGAIVAHDSCDGVSREEREREKVRAILSMLSSPQLTPAAKSHEMKKKKPDQQ
jgi:hypothetical protein